MKVFAVGVIENCANRRNLNPVELNKIVREFNNFAEKRDAYMLLIQTDESFEIEYVSKSHKAFGILRIDFNPDSCKFRIKDCNYYLSLPN